MDNRYQLYQNANAYNSTSVAHDYDVPSVPERKDGRAIRKEKMEKAVTARMIVYILSVLLVFLCGLLSQIMFKAETDALADNQDTLERLEQVIVQKEAELARKKSSENIRRIATEELGMTYVTNEPVYIRVKMGEQITVHQ